MHQLHDITPTINPQAPPLTSRYLVSSPALYPSIPGLQGGHDLYDPMKAGYSHLDATSQRYDMLGMQGMHRPDMYASPPSSYAQMAQFSPPVHSQAMLIPGHPHHMMMGHGQGMPHHGMASAQSPPLHMEGMGGHIQDIHAG